MGFYEDIAYALDAEGIESRVNDGVLFVPISEDVELQFEQIKKSAAAGDTPAATVFVTMPAEDDEDVDEGEFEAALVGVVFTPEAAVDAVQRHIATDEAVSLLSELLEGDDDRIVGFNFEQDEENPLTVVGNVGEDSHVQIDISDVDGRCKARVSFVTFPESALDLAKDVFEEIFAEPEDMDDPERHAMYERVMLDLSSQHEELLDLGTFDDFDMLFDVLAYVEKHGAHWASLMDVLDDGSEDSFDMFDDDDDYDDDLEDEDEQNVVD